MTTWSQRLLRVRKRLRLNQQDFVDELARSGIHASQSDISRWEGGKKLLPQELRDCVEKWEVELRISPQDAELEEEVHVPEFCFGATTFRQLWKESKKRIKRISADATISPCRPKVDGFADIEMTIRFEGISLPPNDPLFLDCLGVMPELKKKGNEYSFDKRNGSELTWVACSGPRADRTIGTVEEVEKVQASLGPYALGYRLVNVVEEVPVEVIIRGARGVRTDDIDAIGVPVYGYCPVESLSLSVTFEKLKPWPTPRASCYELTRTLGDSRPLELAGGLKVTSIDAAAHRYSFENLLYPKVGHGFCIAWDRLD